MRVYSGGVGWELVEPGRGFRVQGSGFRVDDLGLRV